MADNVIKVTIKADGSQYNKELEIAQKNTKAFADGFDRIAIEAGAAFAALGFAAGKAIHAFGESEKATKKLTIAIENQGLNAQKLIPVYDKLAEKLQEKTGIDDDAIKSGIGILQNFIGQREVSEELVTALVDLSEKTGSVDSAAQALGRAVNGSTRALRLQGIQVDSNLSKGERLTSITEQIAERYGGLAEAGNKGIGSTRGLTTAFENLQEEIGKRLAPAFTIIVKSLTSFITQLQNNKPLLDFIVNIGIAASVVAGGITAIAASVAIFGRVTAILTAFSGVFSGIVTGIGSLVGAVGSLVVAFRSLGLASRILVGGTGIGLLLIVAFEIYENWEKIWPAVTGFFESFYNKVTGLAKGLGTILKGAISFDLNQVNKGFSEVGAEVTNGFKDLAEKASGKKIEVGIEEKKKKAGGPSLAAIQEEEEQRKLDVQKASNDLQIAEAEGHSKRLIDLKKQEVELRKALEETENSEQEARLQEQIVLNEAAQAEQLERERVFLETQLAQNAEYQALTLEEQAAFKEQYQASILSGAENESSIRLKLANDTAQLQAKENARYLETQAKFGTAVAEIEKITQSQRLEALNQGLGAFAGLQRSKNKELQAIGKAAAITQIGIDTAKGALAAYTNMIIAIPFPPVAIPLGIAAAAAVVATGAQSIADVVSAQRGGIVPGASMGGDSVPAILEPGELVVPRANFGEVVNAVAAQRIQDSPVASSGVSAGGAAGGSAMITIGFEGQEAEKVLTARQVESRSLGILREAQA